MKAAENAKSTQMHSQNGKYSGCVKIDWRNPSVIYKNGLNRVARPSNGLNLLITYQGINSPPSVLSTKLMRIQNERSFLELGITHAINCVYVAQSKELV